MVSAALIRIPSRNFEVLEGFREWPRMPRGSETSYFPCKGKSCHTTQMREVLHRVSHGPGNDRL